MAGRGKAGLPASILPGRARGFRRSARVDQVGVRLRVPRSLRVAGQRRDAAAGGQAELFMLGAIAYLHILGRRDEYRIIPAVGAKRDPHGEILVLLLIGAGQHAAPAGEAALPDGAQQTDPLVQRIERLEALAAIVGDVDLGAAIGGRRGIAAGGQDKRQGKSGCGRETLHIDPPAAPARLQATPALARYNARSETLSILPVPSLGSGSSETQI